MRKRNVKPSREILQTNKVWTVLCTLQHEEHIRLLRFLNSPYFISSKTMAPLCSLFVREIELGKKGFDRHKIWHKLFPNEPFHEINFRKYCSDLLRLTEQFMAQELLTRDPVQQNLNTFSFALEHSSESILPGLYRQTKSVLEKKKFKSLKDFYQAYLLECRYYDMMEYDLKVDLKSNLNEISKQLDLFYMIEKLRLFGAMLSHQKTSNFAYKLEFMSEIRQYLKDFMVDESPELAVYYYSFLMLYDESEVAHYYKLRQLLEAYALLMPQKEAIELYDTALHYTTGRINKGDRDFLQEYFHIFEEGIQKGIFLQNGELAVWRFNNIIASALGLGKLEWALEFVEKYTNHLPEESRQNTRAFNLARIYRFQKKYDQVLELLQNVEYEDIGVNLISKMVLLITHYERKDHEVLESFIESFRMFLTRHKNIPQQRRIGYQNLLKYTKKLVRILPGDKAGIQKMKEEIKKQKAAIVNHEWLLEKLAEL